VEGGGDGIFILILGVVLVAAGGSALVGFIGQVKQLFLGMSAAIAAGVVIVNPPNLSEVVDLMNREPFSSAGYGAGLFVIGGGVVVAGVTILSARKLLRQGFAQLQVRIDEIPLGGLPGRHTPGPSQQIVTRLGAGQEVEVIERRGAWALVRTTSGETWWVDGRRLVQ
jgi:hypothetical protein